MSKKNRKVVEMENPKAEEVKDLEESTEMDEKEESTEEPKKEESKMKNRFKKIGILMAIGGAIGLAAFVGGRKSANDAFALSELSDNGDDSKSDEETEGEDESSDDVIITEF